MSSRKSKLGISETESVADELLAGTVAVLVCRRGWTIGWANGAAMRLLGTRPAGRKLQDFLGVEDTDPSGTAVGPGVRQFRREDGRLFWAFVATSKSRSGRVLQILEADSYIRERDRLAYQETLWRHAIEAAGHAVWDYNANNEA